MIEYEKVDVNSERWFDLTPLLNEEFRDIKGYEGLYQISNYGRTKNYVIYGKYKNIRISKTRKNQKGYLLVSLSKNGKRKYVFVHRLVAQTFISNSKNKPQVNHIDCDKQNNKVDNLEWCDNSENQIHALKNGLTSMEKCYSKTSKKTLQFDSKDNLIATFYSASEASRKTGISQTGISQCCRKKGKIKGYKFEYEI